MKANEHEKNNLEQVHSEEAMSAIADDLEKHELQQVDTLHDDEAVRIIANYHGEKSWTASEEENLLKKIDWKLLPILCGTYALLYYDKAMIGQAAIFGLRKDLELETGNRYSFASAIFYLGYIIGAYPAIVFAQRFPIERVAGCIVVLWGTTVIVTPACTTFRGLYAVRFFLGVTEAGISPMFMMIVGGWYKKNEQAFRMGAWYSCTGFVSMVSPLINYGLGHIHGALSPWRYMYLVAGSITILWGIVVPSKGVY